MVTYNDELVTRDNQSCHNDITLCHEIGLSVAWYDVALIWHDENRHQRGLLTVCFSSKDAGMTWMMQKETVKGEFHLLWFLSGVV